MDFKNLYEKAPEKLKLDFLDGIISENRNLQTAFVNFANSAKNQKAEITYQRFKEIVAETLKYYKARFEEVDLENLDWDNYHPSVTGYTEEWEQYQEASEQEFSQIFDEFKTDAVDTIIQQKPEELTAMLAGLYKAILVTDIPDPVCSFEDVNEYLLEEHNRIMNEITEKVLLSAVSDSAIITTCKLFFKYAQTECPGDEHFVTYFENFLLPVSDKSNQPDKILSVIDQSKTDRRLVPRLILLLHQKAGNGQEWLQAARQYYPLNTDVSTQLLAYYFNNDKPEFLKLAYELFKKEPGYLAKQLREYITAELDTALFVNVFYRLVVDEKSMTDFHKLRPHIPEEKLEQLLKEINYDKPFKVQVLAAEQRYEEIKKIIELHPGDWHFPELITPILEVYPEFCFNQISSKARRTIETERGRSVYQRVVRWLQLADVIPGYKSQNRLLARELYNHKPNLPALRDELRQGGLV
jgi:hypothetical protein